MVKAAKELARGHTWDAHSAVERAVTSLTKLQGEG